MMIRNIRAGTVSVAHDNYSFVRFGLNRSPAQWYRFSLFWQVQKSVSHGIVKPNKAQNTETAPKPAPPQLPFFLRPKSQVLSFRSSAWDLLKKDVRLSSTFRRLRNGVPFRAQAIGRGQPLDRLSMCAPGVLLGQTWERRARVFPSFSHSLRLWTLNLVGRHFSWPNKD